MSCSGSPPPTTTPPTATTTTTTAPAPDADCSPAPTSCSPPSRPTAPTPSSSDALAELADRDTPERIATADAYFAAVAARVVLGGNRACYQPGTDTICLPDLAQFDQAAHFYATSAHEHVHWTGHPDRLARDLTGRFGSDAYAAEELVAELGAAMWCAQAGISATTRPDHAAYLAHWLRVLRSVPRALVTVAARAQAAVDHLNTLAGHPATEATAA